MSPPPYISDFWNWIGGGLISVGVALGIWTKARKDNVEVRRRSSDGDVGAAENTSRQGWIKAQDDRLQALQQRCDACEYENTELRAQVSVLTERTNAQAREMNRIKRALYRVAPEMQGVFDSNFGDLDQGSDL